MDSVDYYNKHAYEYFEKTINVDMSESLEHFISLLPANASILDLGCGSGRDSAYFIDRGFDVTAVDASKEMCQLASVHTGLEALNLSFVELDFIDVFDGIWACASLLHVPSNEIAEVLSKVIAGLKVNGVLFMSFRHGDFEGMRGERYYIDYKTRTLKELISAFKELELIEITKSSETEGDAEKTWIRAIVRKVSPADSNITD